MTKQYTPGMRVIIREEEWMIRKTETNTIGNTALYCVGVSPLVKEREAVFLSDLEGIEIVDPANVRFVPDDSSHFIKSMLYIESQWRQKIPTDEKLYIGDQAAMDLMQYQLEPASLALARPRQRILISDAVGLGKTLEAGILMSELMVRGKGRRILVVTVKSMMAQFQKEMWNRFTIPLVRLDSKRIQRIRQNLPSNANPFFYYDKTIISIDTLKRDIEYRTHLENAYWDIIVIDEAQNVAKRGDRQAQRSRLATLLADRSDTMIMLSATPHDGRPESFASLMKMLDPTAIANEKEYTEKDIQGLFIRRFKKDIKDQVRGAFLERVVTLERCAASAKEEIAYDAFADMELQMDADKKKGSGQLFKTSLLKSLFSSPAACIKSIDERLKKLTKRYPDGKMPDIAALTYLKERLQEISAKDFSRYQKLLSILQDDSYGWNGKDTDDRLVIFTERIETMHFLGEHLQKDLGLKKDAVQEVSGSMSDTELLKIVEDFGREESPIRVLVASDVASEGLNLHYLSHRMIHFDIPWSLMVFQQRNGRIDRYGQTKQPDIRYLVETSKNERIRGDLRNLEILVEKEEQALKNIGDPALLLGQFTIEGEELVVAQAMEEDHTEDSFSKMLEQERAAFDPLEALLSDASGKGESGITSETAREETLLKDADYLYHALVFLGQKERRPVERLKAVSGLDITITEDLRRRLSALMPEEAMPKEDTLRLSDDKAFCMDEMRKAQQNQMEDAAWPSVGYLWKLHPVMSFINDKAGLLYKRDEVPLIGVKKHLQSDELIYIMNGIYPNRKSTPLIDSWFGVHMKAGAFAGILTMEEVVQKTWLRHTDNVNAANLNDKDLKQTKEQFSKVLEETGKQLKKDYMHYQGRINPLISEEIDKLDALEKEHYHQLSLFEEARVISSRQKAERERQVKDLFAEFVDWVHASLDIEDNPYIRVIAVLKGA